MNQKQSKKERKELLNNTVKAPVDRTAFTSNLVIAVVIAAFLGLGGYAVGSKIAKDKANAPAEDTAQTEQQQTQTLKSTAEAAGMTTKEYLEKYGLDSSISDDTAISQVYSKMTVANLAAANDKDVDTFRQENFVPDSISNDTVWENVIPELPFKAVVGEEQVAQIKSFYGLDDSITADTKWSEVEPILNAKSAEMSAAMNNAKNGENSGNADGADNSAENSNNADNSGENSSSEQN